jgi:hypothetical protein
VSDLECDTGCCGFKTGVCAGKLVAQSRDGGCGFGDDEPNDGTIEEVTVSAEDDDEETEDVEAAEEATDAKAVEATPVSAGKTVQATGLTGSKVITQKCVSDLECDTSCCGFKTGVCAGKVVAQIRDGGCGRGDDSPNDGLVKRLIADRL